MAEIIPANMTSVLQFRSANIYFFFGFISMAIFSGMATSLSFLGRSIILYLVAEC